MGDQTNVVGVDEGEEASISGKGCLGVIAAGVLASVLLYVFVMSRNAQTRGPAYMAASALFGFFVVGIIWAVAQQQRESDASRDAELTQAEADEGELQG